MSAGETKDCASCGRTITWRKKWARDWDSVRYCSDACRRVKVSPTDRELEESIRSLLATRAAEATITQGGAVVDPSTAKGPIRIRRVRRG